jgi:L-histidine N-alpha-methyltransferase
VRELLGPEDHFLVGAGLVIDRRTLEAAYDDSAGVTAEFNRNMLLVLNDGLGANFDPEAFEHVAVWDADASRIEMRLRSLRDQRVALPGADMNVDLRAGEEIRTEISTKFTREAFAHELDAAGMRLESFFSDDARRFGLALAAPA